MMNDTAALTLEILRDDVAAILDEAPPEIGVDENLFDLGLDSMRMLGLVLKWGNSGIALEFSALAEYSTLTQWWQVIERLQAAKRA